MGNIALNNLYSMLKYSKKKIKIHPCVLTQNCTPFSELLEN